jgi:hypothetical protein
MLISHSSLTSSSETNNVYDSPIHPTEDLLNDEWLEACQLLLIEQLQKIRCDRDVGRRLYVLGLSIFAVTADLHAIFVFRGLAEVEHVRDEVLGAIGFLAVFWSQKDLNIERMASQSEPR